MNKAELVAKIAEDAGITKTQANASLDSFVEAVTKTLKGGGKVTLVGFGTFSVTKRAARNGRNPQTGAVIKIKAKKVAMVQSRYAQKKCTCFFCAPSAGKGYIHSPKNFFMGRGDKKSKKGKIFRGSFGKSRLAKPNKHSKRVVKEGTGA
jgi:DNA-binding protein HU-beta